MQWRRRVSTGCGLGSKSSEGVSDIAPESCIGRGAPGVPEVPETPKTSGFATGELHWGVCVIRMFTPFEAFHLSLVHNRTPWSMCRVHATILTPSRIPLRVGAHGRSLKTSILLQLPSISVANQYYMILELFLFLLLWLSLLVLTVGLMSCQGTISARRLRSWMSRGSFESSSDSTGGESL